MLLCTCRPCPEGPQVSNAVRRPRLLPWAHSVHRVGGHETHSKCDLAQRKLSLPPAPQLIKTVLFCFASNQLPDCSLAFGGKKKKYMLFTG